MTEAVQTGAGEALAWVDRAMQRPRVRSGLWVATAVAAFVLFVSAIFPAPPAVLFYGAVLGSLSAVTAMGIVLVYRANRVINFAQGDLGAVPGILAVSLIAGRGWSFYPAFLVGLLAAAALGAFVEVVIIRRFARAPRLILSVATIGIALLCQGGELFLPRLFGYTTPPQDFPTPLDMEIEWSPVIFRGSHVFAIVVIPLVAIGLTTFLRRARFGKAMRAAAESTDRALLLGIPVRRVNTLVWVLAALLSALAFELRAPIVGVPIGTVLGPALLLRALAAAVIGRMENLTVTFFAAVLLGVVEQAVLWDVGKTTVIDGVLFFVIIGALLIQRRGSESRADDRGASTWSTVAEVRPVPPELRSLPEVRWARAGAGLLVAVLFLVVPLSAGPGRVNLLSQGVIYALIALSLMFLTGWAGQISLGQMAFVGVGAAIAASLTQAGWPFFVVLGVVGCAGAVVAAVIGLPALRVRGPFLAVATFAFSLAASSFFLNAEFFGWLMPSQDRIVRPVLFDKFDLESEHAFYYLVLLVFVATLISVRSLRNSRTGRVLIAARDNERAAQSFGVNLLRSRLVGFALSGFVAALAGALFTFHQHGLTTRSFVPEESLRVFTMAVFGGLGSAVGVVLGATWFTAVDYFTNEPLLRFFLNGGGLLFVLLFLPGGLTQLVFGARDRLLRLVAVRRRIIVPSLVSDERADRRGSLESTPKSDGTAAAPPGTLLSVRGLDVAYGQTQVLFGVDLDVADGEVVALLGTNGAGKSTLLNAVCGLVSPSAGTVTFDGRTITGNPANRTAAQGIVLVPGGKGVFPTLTVAENIDLAGWLYQGEREYLTAAVAQVLEYFPILESRWNEKAGNLSGGEQQMLTLGQAFIAKPKLLMIDELSLGLAPVIVEQLLEIVKAIHSRGTTIVLVEQSVNVAMTAADRAVFMEKGEVRFDGPTAELLDRPDILRAVFLQGASSVVESSGKTLTAVRERTPFEPSCAACGHEHAVALETRGLSVSFGGIRAVNEVDLAVRQGQIVGLIGHNGAGKTTILDLVSGFLSPSAGRVVLDGVDVTELTPDLRAVAGLGRSFQDARLFPAMTVAETIAVALERHIVTRDPLAAALASPATREAETEVRDRVDDLIQLMNLQAFANKFVSELSTGTRRVVDLACSLAHGPSVLLLDEPSSGIAQRETEALAPVLLDIRDRTGAAMVVIEHDMPLITSIADELVALDLGSVIARGKPDVVVDDPQVVASYLGSTEAVVRRSGELVGATKGRPRTKKRKPA